MTASGGSRRGRVGSGLTALAAVLALAVAATTATATATTGNQCSCDFSAQRRQFSRHHSMHSPVHSKVKFREAAADKRGADYTRPVGGSPLYKNRASERQRQLDELDVDCKSEQVHISLGYELDSAIISFATPYVNTSSIVYYSTDEAALFQDDMSLVMQASGHFQAYSELLYISYMALNPYMDEAFTTEEEVLKLQDTSKWAYDHKTGEHYANWKNVTEVSYGSGHYKNPDMMYHSPVIHTVPIYNLKNGVKYYYRVEGSCDVHQFTLPYYSLESEDNADAYPFTLGMTGDLGQTEVSAMSMAALAAMQPAAVLLVGDLSYADGWCPGWDSFGQLFESLAATIPVLTTGGNHENGFAENNVPYYTRYSTPHVGAGSPDQTYWGREVGPVHVIGLYTYAGYTPDSLQYQWLENYLSTKINRQRTPWVLVMSHMGWYNSNTGHWMESEHSRSYLEPLLYKYGVDILLGGHIHSYERSFPVYNNTLDECGMTTLNLGDGGNYEGAYVPWRIDPDTANGQPEWSAFRESSFGVGDLTVVNATHAFYGWHRHACASDQPGANGMNFSTNCRSPGDNSEQNMETSDMTWFVRPSADACPNRHTGTSSFIPSQSATLNNNDDDEDTDYTELEVVLFAVIVLTFLISTVVIVFLIRKLADKSTDSLLKSQTGTDSSVL